MAYPYPLGLPKGSVRSSITLLLSLTLVFLTLDDSIFADQIATMTVVALTFYFGGNLRSSAPVPRDAYKSLRAWGLPAGSIRSILIFIFAGTFGYMVYEGLEIPAYLSEIVNIIGGFLIGNMYHKIFKKGKEDKNKVGIFDHLKALAVLGMTIASVYLTIFSEFSESIIDLYLLINSLLLGFYFGARK